MDRASMSRDALQRLRAVVVRTVSTAYAIFTGRNTPWHRGLTDELAFWDRWLCDAGTPGFRFRTDPESMLQPWIECRLDAGRSVHRILDVGSGPLSVIGRKSSVGAIEVTCCDPLAHGYIALLARHQVLNQHSIVAVAAETLSSHFPDGHFDIAFSNNAIDHSQDPIKVLREMALVTRVGGVIIIQVAVNEGKRGSYTGLHQWDCAMEGGRFTIAARNSEPVDVASEVSHLLDPVIIESVTVSPAGLTWDRPHIRAVFLRRNAQL